VTPNSRIRRHGQDGTVIAVGRRYLTVDWDARPTKAPWLISRSDPAIEVLEVAA
jgi:hypothetical protein